MFAEMGEVDPDAVLLLVLELVLGEPFEDTLELPLSAGAVHEDLERGPPGREIKNDDRLGFGDSENEVGRFAIPRFDKDRVVPDFIEDLLDRKIRINQRLAGGHGAELEIVRQGLEEGVRHEDARFPLPGEYRVHVAAHRSPVS